MADPRRQMIGRRSKASGETFEHWISNACNYYLEKGYAFIEKTPEPFHITGKDQSGVVRGYYEKQGQPDYKGIPDIYLYLWQAGTRKGQLRVSQFFSVDTARSLVKMNEYYPDLMERVTRREPNAYLAALYCNCAA